MVFNHHNSKTTVFIQRMRITKNCSGSILLFNLTYGHFRRLAPHLVLLPKG